MRPRSASCAAAPSGRQSSATTLATRDGVIAQLLFVRQQKQAERAGREREQPEEEEAERVSGERPELDLVTEEIELYRIDHGEEDHLGEAAGEEGRPENHGPSFHHTSRSIRHAPRGSSMTMRQWPGGSGSSGAS